MFITIIIYCVNFELKRGLVLARSEKYMKKQRELSDNAKTRNENFMLETLGNIKELEGYLEGV